MSELQTDIEQLFDLGDRAEALMARAAFVRLRDALSEGSVRAAEPDADAPTGWRVNPWVKKGILLGFRFGRLVDVSMDHGKWPFFDKDTMPIKTLALDRQVRLVPGGSAVREGAFVGRGVICMPPMYINIGAYVGECTLVDSHALVGSCAQIGAKVHISAGAQIGGVIEPVGALARDHRGRGARRRQHRHLRRGRRQAPRGHRRRHGADRLDADLRPAQRPILKPADGLPIVIPEGAVVVPGARAVTVGAGKDWGLSLATPVIVKYRDDKTDTRTELERWIR